MQEQFWDRSYGWNALKMVYNILRINKLRPLLTNCKLVMQQKSDFIQYGVFTLSVAEKNKLTQAGREGYPQNHFPKEGRVGKYSFMCPCLYFFNWWSTQYMYLSEEELKWWTKGQNKILLLKLGYRMSHISGRVAGENWPHGTFFQDGHGFR